MTRCVWAVSLFVPLLVLRTAPAAEVDPAVLEAEAARIAVMAKVEPAVLAIFESGGRGGGSGVVISPDGYALSNFHVTAGAGVAMKCGMADGRLYDAVIVGLDPTGDVALIKLLGRDDFPYARLGNSDQLRAGDWVFAMGNPFLLATDFKPTVTYGIVSGVHRYQYPAGTLLEYTDCIQTDASINPGNSGGPLFDQRGQLVGINGRGSFEKRGRVNVGVGYAISINQIKNFLGYLKSGRIVDHATLGATVKTDAEGRVVVTEMLDSCDAWRRGLRPGDEVLRFGGRVISSANGLKNVLGIFPKGWRVPMVFVHGGRRHEVYVRLEGAHREGELATQISGGPSRRQPRPPGKNPGNDDPGGDSDKPRQPKQQDDKPSSPTAKTRVSRLPDLVRHQYEPRRGYANYHFNRLAQQRIIEALKARGNFADVGGPWSIQGSLKGGGHFAFNLEKGSASAVLPAGEVTMTVSDDLSESLQPPGSGGLLTALWMWRRLLARGLDGLDEVYYLGTAPLPGRDSQYEVLVALQAGVECRYWVDPQQSVLVLIELFPSEEVDPCEIKFDAYGEADGRLMPRRIEVRHGDALYGVFQAELFSLIPEAQP